MPPRKIALVNGYYYHIINRGVAGAPIFKGKRDFRRMLRLIEYYQFRDTPVPFSQLNRMPTIEQGKIIADLKRKGDRLVEIVCFCFVPNHFHLLLKQTDDVGIMSSLRNLQTGYAKYFNTKHERVGPLFQNRFKAILVETEEQILHLSRYIHLNPYSSLVLSRKGDILTYPWSSLPQYLGDQEGICKTEVILSQFKNRQEYKDFVLDRAAYQQELQKIKHLLLEYSPISRSG